MLLELLKDTWGQASQSLKDYKNEVDTLRDLGEVRVDETFEDLHDRLIRSRRAQDRIEAILANLGIVKSVCRRALQESQAAYDDKWRQAMLSSQVGDYSSAQERNATYTSKAIDELIALRNAQKILSEVEEVYEYVLLKYRGVDNSRRDIDTRIKLLSVGNSFER